MFPATPPARIVIADDAVVKSRYDGNIELFPMVAVEIALHIPAFEPKDKTLLH